MALKIEDYAMIGDCKTAALVGRNGSIDWLCWPRFDSAACFAALLGECENGRWLIAPKEESIEVSRRYRSGTLVLETEFHTKSGRATLVDFMIPGDGAHLVRILIGRQGQVDFRNEFVVRFNYGATVPWVNRLDDGGISAIAGPERLVLRTPAALHGEDLKTIGEFAVEVGQSVPFVLSYGPSFQNHPPEVDAFDALERTEAFWREWSDRCPEVGPWTEAVKRSLIILKALTFAPTGGIVAAPTTSLPEPYRGREELGLSVLLVTRRDLHILALMYLGYYDEARAWRDWLIRAVAGSPEQVQIVYGVGGERWLPELTVSWLAGYENSKPVRIGNAAYNQLQLDVLGEVADALFQAGKVGIGLTERGRALRPIMLEYLARVWRDPDEGIWEVRGGPQHFVHSKVMAWVAFDRAAHGFAAEGSSEAARHWRAVADEIHTDVCERGFDPDLDSFVQTFGSKRLDASLLLIPLVGFLRRNRSAREGHASSDRGEAAGRTGVRSAVRTGESRRRPASRRRSLFGVQLLARRQLHPARALCRSPETLRSIVVTSQRRGSARRRVRPVFGRMLGNFPQAYSHVGLINCALDLPAKRAPPRSAQRRGSQ